MSALSIQVPFPVFQDRDGQPLDNGYVWIGTANLNPQTNPVVAYYDADLTIVAVQPLRTINGYISRAGSPAQVYVDGANFSILVQDSKGTMVYNFPDGSGISPNASGVIYDPAGTGAVATTVQAKLRESVSALNYTTLQEAIDAATALGKTVELPDGAYSSGALTVTTSLIGVGRERCILTLTDQMTVTVSDVLITGLTISGGNTIFGSGTMVKVNTGCNHVRIIDNSIGQVAQAATPYSEMYAIRFDISAAGCQDFIVAGNRFSNIFKTTVLDATATDGFAGGIFFDGAASAVTGSSSGMVYDNVFDTIRTTGNTTASTSDADGIRFYSNASPGDVSMTSHQINLDNNYFLEVEKSAIKISGVGGLTITNTKIINTSAESMEAFIRLQTGDNITIDGVHASGQAGYGFVMSGNNNVIRNVSINYSATTASSVTSLVYFQKRQSGVVETNLIVENVFGRGIRKIAECLDTLSVANVGWFGEITFNNINCILIADSANDTMFDIRNAQSLTLNNITLTGESARAFVALDNTPNVYLNNISALARETFIKPANTQAYVTINTGNVSIKNVRTSRHPDSTRTVRFIELQNTTTGTALTGQLVLQSVDIVDSYATAPANNELIFARASNRVTIRDITVYFSGAGTSAINVIRGVLNNFSISGLNIINSATADAAYAVFLTGSSKGAISGINVSGVYNGVSESTSSSILVSGVRVDSAQVAATGAGLTIDSASVVAV